MKRVLVPIFATSLLFSSTAFGAVSEEQIQELREQLAVMSQRLGRLPPKMRTCGARRTSRRTPSPTSSQR